MKFRNPDKLDFTLKKESPAVDAGMKIPGFNDDAKGAPDIGPFEFGEKIGPDWPRPRRTVFNVNPPEVISGRKQPPRIQLFVEPIAQEGIDRLEIIERRKP